jgi:two-component system, chemotaxis family, sensor kinase Cph1
MTHSFPSPSSSSSALPQSLIACEREPIHHPGAIQPHGVLLVCRAHDLLVLQVSANAERLFERGVALLLGRRLGDLFDATPLALASNASAEMLVARNPVEVVVAGRPYEAILHRVVGRIVVELEPSHPSDRARAFSRQAQRRLHHALARLRGAKSTGEVLEAAAHEVATLTGFDRALVYRFEPDEHGVVVAESRRDGVASYLGLHFPATGHRGCRG